MSEPFAKPAPPSGQYCLAGPADRRDAAHWPARGDLAHIALAGRCFVPHYVVPMAHIVAAGGAVLRKGAGEAHDSIFQLGAGAHFDVLDIAGGWCWGQAGEGGLVGYLPQNALKIA